MTFAELPHQGWRCLAATPWLTAADSGRALPQFLGAPWRLPSWVPGVSGRHTLSPLLPPAAGVSKLLRALHGRLFVVNQLPVAVIAREEATLIRALVGRALAGSVRPWTAAPRGAAAAWPADSRAAHAAMLAREWLAARGAESRWDGAAAAAVAVALYEGPAVITADDPRGSAWSGGAPSIARVVAEVRYRLVVVARRTNDPAAVVPRLDVAADVQEALAARMAVGAGPERPWFGGRVLLPDAAAVAAMDLATRRQWAGVTGRAGGRDAYWFPESWARFLEPGRTLGCVTAAQVGRSAPSRARAETARGPAFDPGVERGLCVPPGYALVDCAATLGMSAVVL